MMTPAWAVDHRVHNSHLVVIQKRDPLRRPLQAYQPNKDDVRQHAMGTGWLSMYKGSASGTG